jgi:hypothetical protein
MENASQAFLDGVRKSMRDVRTAVGVATINPELLTSAEKLQYEGFQRREETNAAILAMSKEGATIKQIVRRASYSRGLVRKVLRGQRSDVFRVRSSSLEAYLPWLDEQWAARGATERNYGAPSRAGDFVDAPVSSAGGADDVVTRKRWTRAPSGARLQREPSRG